jgi:GNAT superfamily N-acetyltransferase
MVSQLGPAIDVRSTFRGERDFLIQLLSNLDEPEWAAATVCVGRCAALPGTAPKAPLSPWLLGMIVRRDRRGSGLGRLLLARLERWAYSQGYELWWVATGGAASTSDAGGGSVRRWTAPSSRLRS